jgi:hypothetical protein
MPQLDTLTFFSQFFWLSFFFLGFYGMLVKYYLPKLSRILKIRTRKISNIGLGAAPQNLETSRSEAGSVGLAQDIAEVHGNPSYLQLESKNIRKNGDSFLTNLLFFDFFHEKMKNTSTWLKTMVELTNKNQFKTLNNKYLFSVGNFQAYDIFLFYHLKSVIAPTGFHATNLNKLFQISTPSGIAERSSLEKIYNYRILKNI